MTYRMDDMSHTHVVSTSTILKIIVVFSVLWSGVAWADTPKGLSPQTVKLPSGPASLKGLGESFSPNIATGTGGYSVLIQVPPGHITPDVKLVYSGGSGQGEAGLGFRLPVLNIYRTTDKGLPEFKEEDRFAVSGPGINDELVLVNAEERFYRLKNESVFALFVRDAKNDYWTIRYPDGKTATLGKSQDSRQYNHNGTYHWFVSSVSDQFGHVIDYDYFSDKSHLYLQSIRYQQESVGHENEIILDYENRPDIKTDYRYGSAETIALRINTISVWHGSRRLRNYSLSYKRGLLFSLLETVTMEGEQDLSMPPLTFGYVDHTNDSGGYVLMRNVPPLEGLATGRTVFEDVNRDGLPDLLIGNAGGYQYYENIDGIRFSGTPTSLRHSPDASLGDEGVVLTDVDGDGYRDVLRPERDDFLYFPAGTVTRGVFLEYNGPVTLKNGGSSGFHWGQTEVKQLDLNFDGRTDLLYRVGQGILKLENRKDDTLIETWLGDLPPDVVFDDDRISLSDFNGDGLLDFVYTDISYERSTMRVWYGLGHGRYAPEESMRNVPLGDRNEYFLQDVNRDGQTDLIRHSGSDVAYFLNDGNGHFLPKKGNFTGMPASWKVRQTLFADMNGNGSVDIVWHTKEGELQYLDMLRASHFGLLQSVDNGMGMVSTIQYRSSTSYSIEAKKKGEPWKTPMPHPVQVISSISTTDSFDKLGLQPNEVTSIYQYRNGFWDGKEREFRGFAEVTTLQPGDEFHEGLVTHTYMHVGRNLANGRDEEILKGKPHTQVVEDEQGNIYSSVETNWQIKWLCQQDLTGVSQNVLPTCPANIDPDADKDNLVAFAVNKSVLTGSWERTNSPRYTYSETEHDAWGQPIKATQYGEVTFLTEHHIGQPFERAELNVEIGEDEVVSVKQNIYDVEKWLIDFPKLTRTEDLFGQVYSQNRMYYDGDDFVGLPFGEITKGLLTRQETGLLQKDGTWRWINSTRKAYTNDGKIRATKDANGNLVEIDYDAETNQFPIVERVFVEQGILEYKAGYDAGLGLALWGTDFNGHTTNFHFDGLGRLDWVVDPLGNEEKPTLRYSYEYGTQNNPISTTQIEKLIDRDKSIYRKSWIYSDGLGRKRLTKIEAEDPHGYIGSGWVLLSSRGNPTHTFDSFASSWNGFEPAPSETPVTISYLDGQGRAKQVYPPDVGHGSTYTLTEYYPFETKVYDERDSNEQSWLYPAINRIDGLGRTREIVKYNDYDNIRTELKWTVGYDTLGNITSITDPKNNIRNYQYDSLKRLIYLQDPNVGSVNFEYDDVGNLTKRIDALGQERVYDFGLANRLLHSHFYKNIDGVIQHTHSYSYHYDAPSDLFPEATNLKGQLSWVDWPHGTELASFDALGRRTTQLISLWDPTRSDEQHQQRDTFRKDFQYNAASEVLSIKLPGNLEVSYGYNARGLTSHVYASFGSPTEVLAKSLEYDHRGAMQKSIHGNQTTTCYWADARGQTIGVKTTLSGQCGQPDTPDAQSISQLFYYHTPTGLIEEVEDLSPVREQVPRYDAKYKYDRLYELTEAKTNKEGDTYRDTTTYAYDSIQNLVERESSLKNSKLILGEWKYGEYGSGPNQVTTAGEHSFTYDDLGNLQQHNGFDLEFDEEGRLVKASKLGTTIRYIYDHAGERRLKITDVTGRPLKVNRYVFGEYQIRNGKQYWLVKAGDATAEITKSQILRPTLSALDGIVQNLNSDSGGLKYLPFEYQDQNLSNTADEEDVTLLLDAYWEEKTISASRDYVIRYYHNDHLGGPTHTTDLVGNMLSDTKFHPYGLLDNNHGNQPIWGFTGAERDEESELGLIRMGARYYSPGLGRWASADEYFFGDPSKIIANILEGNLYSYAKNCPTFFVDPNGTRPLDLAKELKRKPSPHTESYKRMGIRTANDKGSRIYNWRKRNGFPTQEAGGPYTINRQYDVQGVSHTTEVSERIKYGTKDLNFQKKIAVTEGKGYTQYKGKFKLFQGYVAVGGKEGGKPYLKAGGGVEVELASGTTANAGIGVEVEGDTVNGFAEAGAEVANVGVSTKIRTDGQFTLGFSLSKDKCIVKDVVSMKTTVTHKVKVDVPTFMEGFLSELFAL